MKKQVVCLAIAFGIVGSGLYMVKGSSSSDTLYPPPDEDEFVTTTEAPGAPKAGIYGVHPQRTDGDINGLTTYFGDADEDTASRPKENSSQK